MPESQFPQKSYSLHDDSFRFLQMPFSSSQLTCAGTIKCGQFGVIGFVSLIKKKKKYMDLHSLSSPKSPACFAHLVSRLSSFHPCKVNKGCEAGVKAREGEFVRSVLLTTRGSA